MQIPQLRYWQVLQECFESIRRVSWPLKFIVEIPKLKTYPRQYFFIDHKPVQQFLPSSRIFHLTKAVRSSAHP